MKAVCRLDRKVKRLRAVRFHQSVAEARLQMKKELHEVAVAKDLMSWMGLRKIAEVYG